MITFLPYPDYVAIAKCLDRRRLGKQRIEALYILQVNICGGKDYNYPNIRMWRGHTNSLIDYGIAMCDEWTSRGYVDNTKPLLEELRNRNLTNDPPSWLGNDKVHASHRGRLLMKNYAWYSQFGWKDSPCLTYYYASTTDTVS